MSKEQLSNLRVGSKEWFANHKPANTLSRVTVAELIRKGAEEVLGKDDTEFLRKSASPYVRNSDRGSMNDPFVRNIAPAVHGVIRGVHSGTGDIFSYLSGLILSSYEKDPPKRKILEEKLNRFAEEKHIEEEEKEIARMLHYMVQVSSTIRSSYLHSLKNTNVRVRFDLWEFLGEKLENKDSKT